MEKHILRTVADYGQVYDVSVAYVQLMAEYWKDDDRTRGQVAAMLGGLEKDGFLNAYTEMNGLRCRALTAKGWDRLYELEHRYLYWMKKQWFPLVVAVASTLIGIVSITISIIFRA